MFVCYVAVVILLYAIPSLSCISSLASLSLPLTSSADAERAALERSGERGLLNVVAAGNTRCEVGRSSCE